MAIIVEEEKKQSHFLNIAGWLTFLMVVGVAVYYIFFTAPAVVILPTPGSLSAIAPLAQSNLQPEDVINSASFQALRTTIQPPSPQGPTSIGRQDPFIAP